MAPTSNSCIKSDSWLDLTADSCQAYKHQLSWRRDTTTTTTSSIVSEQATGHEQQQFNRLLDTNRNRSHSSSRQSLQPTTTISSGNNNNNNNNQHLLIRLRQQSYQRNRSNANSSLSSSSVSLSRPFSGQTFEGRSSSILLGHENRSDILVGTKITSNSESIGTALEKSSCRKPVRESLRLSKLRHRLSGRRPNNNKVNSSCSIDRDLCNNSNVSCDKSNPLARSWSSLSERINGKLSDFRHSWKHFLYQYNHAGRNLDQDESDHLSQQSEQQRQFRANSMFQLRIDNSSTFNDSTMDKSQLTSDWLTRHYHSQANQLSAHEDERIQSDVCIAKTQQKTSPKTNQKFILKQQSDNQSESQSTTSSSATLISGVGGSINSNNKKMQHQTIKQQLIQQENSNEQLTSSENNNNNNNNININWLASKAPTSDYWSTIASSELYKQQINQQLTLMGADNQDYYLDVAAAVNNQQQFLQNQHQQLLQQMQPINFVLTNQAPTSSANNQLLLAPPNVDDYDEDYAVPADESCRLDRSQVELVQLIGEGQKGYVFLGKLQSKDGAQIMDVAIKTLKYETGQLIEKLMREAAMMRQLEHPHIIRFIGVCPETPALIAMELAQFGEVKQYFKLNRQLITIPQLVLFTFQISTALSYLESKNYVHRDVAARNVLVCSHNCVKLADFGLSRNLQPANSAIMNNQQAQFPVIMSPPPPSLGRQTIDMLENPLITDANSNESQYVAAPRVKLPVRWLSPESLVFRRFTSASDVWMFAVCSWELFHLCQLRPWANIRNNQVLAAIEAGQRLQRPPSCPSRLYQLMLQCWSYAPVQRPKFREIKHSIWSIYLNERAKQQIDLEQQQQRFLAQNQPPPPQQQQQRQTSSNFRPINEQQPNQRLVLLDSQQQQSKDQLLIPGNQQVRLQPPQIVKGKSGYSPTGTTTPTATATELSTTANSSRSSSMGSLARQQAIANRLLQHPVIRCEPQTRESQQRVKEKSTKTPGGDKLISAAETNAKRFHKTPGHLLQKQRSQGSIGMATSGQNVDDLLQLNKHRLSSNQRLGLDDDWRRNKRVPSPRLDTTEYEDDGDDEYNESSCTDDISLTEVRQSQVVKHKSDNEFNGSNANRHDIGDEFNAKLRLEDSGYDGLQQQQHRMIVAKPQQPTSGAGGKFWRPASWRAEPETPRPSSGRDPVAQNHTKFGNLLQSLGMAPTKAKLTYGNNRQSSAEPTRNKVSSSGKSPQRKPVKSQSAHRLASGSVIEEERLCEPQPPPPAEAQLERQNEEEHRQLAVHQRLLGRIRPASVASNRSSSNRRSINLSSPMGDNQGPDGTGSAAIRVPTVDQSLQLLESLMTEDDNERRPQQRHQMAANNNVRTSASQSNVRRRAMW